MRRVPWGRALVVLSGLTGAAVGILFHAQAAPAQGSPVDVPAGTVIYTAAASCPAGFTEATFLQGRLVVGTTQAANAGGSLGTPMVADEAPTHRHNVSLNVVIAGKQLQDWCCGIAGEQNVGTAGTYNSSGETSISHSGAPLLQLRACRKP